jgi:PAS domain S-box-containing protein
MPEKPSYNELIEKITRLERENDACRQLEITVRQQEEALKKSEERFRLFFERIPISYQSLDEEGRFVEVNQAWLDTLGYTRDEVVGRSFADFLHPDRVEHFRENFPRFKAIGEVLGVEFEMRKKDGSNILVAFHGKAGTDEEGSLFRTHCIFNDISERKTNRLSATAYQNVQQARFITEIKQAQDRLGESENRALCFGGRQ